jgi:RNA recognition motif. (a.k.a. RRM, RBD, or RNP domain)
MAWIIYLERTRYTNPLKQKFRTKRMAAESRRTQYTASLVALLIGADFFFLRGSGIWDRTSTKKAKCPDARRIPATKQNPFPSKSTRKRYKRPTYGFVLTVAYLFDSYAATKLRLNEINRYPNLHEVRLIPTKKDIAFVEYMDEGSASTAKDALHNYKLDGENKIKVGLVLTVLNFRCANLNLSRHRSRLQENEHTIILLYHLPVLLLYEVLFHSSGHLC